MWHLAAMLHLLTKLALAVLLVAGSQALTKG
jgi:hypothetical protein